MCIPLRERTSVSAGPSPGSPYACVSRSSVDTGKKKTPIQSEPIKRHSTLPVAVYCNKNSTVTN